MVAIYIAINYSKIDRSSSRQLRQDKDTVSKDWWGGDVFVLVPKERTTHATLHYRMLLEALWPTIILNEQNRLLKVTIGWI